MEDPPPLGLYVPAAQLVQEVEPLPLNVPAAHREHTRVPGATYQPALQTIREAVGVWVAVPLGEADGERDGVTVPLHVGVPLGELLKDVFTEGVGVSVVTATCAPTPRRTTKKRSARSAPLPNTLFARPAKGDRATAQPAAPLCAPKKTKVAKASAAVAPISATPSLTGWAAVANAPGHNARVAPKGPLDGAQTRWRGGSVGALKHAGGGKVASPEEEGGIQVRDRCAQERLA